MNTTLPGLKLLQIGSGLDWINAKFRLYAIDLAYTGPTEFSRVIESSSYTEYAEPTSITGRRFRVTINTYQPHGLSVGQPIAISHVGTGPNDYQFNTTYYPGDVVRSADPSANRFKCIVQGTSTEVEDAWTGITYQKQPGQTNDLWFEREIGWSKDTSWAATRNHTIIATTDTSFDITVDETPSRIGDGYVMPLDITYLSDIAPAEISHYGYTPPLTSKVTSANGIATIVFDNLILSQGQIEAYSGHVLILVRTANSDADTEDLPYEQQVAIGMWDYSPIYLPLTYGSVTLPTSFSLVI